MTRVGNIWMEGLIFYGLLEKITELFIKRAAFLCAHISAFFRATLDVPPRERDVSKIRKIWRLLQAWWTQVTSHLCQVPR